MKLFDTHAHYNDEKFDEDREEIIKSVYEYGVKNLVNAGYSLESSKKALEIAKSYDWMYVICGISPNDIPDNKENIDNQIDELRKTIVDYYRRSNVESVDNVNEKTANTVNMSKKIVAIGEIGLD